MPTIYAYVYRMQNHPVFTDFVAKPQIFHRLISCQNKKEIGVKH